LGQKPPKLRRVRVVAWRHNLTHVPSKTSPGALAPKHGREDRAAAVAAHIAQHLVRVHKSWCVNGDDGCWRDGAVDCTWGFANRA
jgi:hypothetical protein